MARALRILLLGALAMSVVACASRSGGGAGAVPVEIASAPGSFAAAPSILSGFELADRDEQFAEFPGWRPGDRVLLGLRIMRGGEETVRYLDVELTDGLVGTSTVTSRADGRDTWEFETLDLQTHIRLYDDAGALLTSINGSFPHLLLNVGVYDAVRHRLDLDARAYEAARRQVVPAAHVPTRDEYRRTGLGWLSVMTFSNSLGRNRVFSRLLDGIVQRPALWRLLVNPAVSINDAEPGPAEAAPWAPRPDLSRPALLVPLELEVGGRPALRGSITVVPPDAPLGLCGGLVHAEAHNPGDPSAGLAIRLLAARRGPYVAPKEYEPGEPAERAKTPGSGAGSTR